MIFIKFASKFHRNLTSLRKFSQISTKEFNLDYENDGEIAILSFNRPKQKNAFSVNLTKEINETLYEITVGKSPRVAILRSLVPGVFCAVGCAFGADLKERATMSHDDVSRFVTNLRSTFNRIYELPFPVIAAIDGLALGGGLEIALACDLRVGSTNSKIGLVETRLGIIPGAGGTQYLPRLIPTPIAKELIYTARILDSQSARNYGIFNHIVEQNETQNAAYLKSLEIAREIIPNGPVAVRMAKMAINKGLEVDLNTGLTIENGCYGQLIHTKDRLEGLQAFQEKRKPNYTGR